MEDNEGNILEIIVKSGEAKALAFEAIQAAKKLDFVEAEKKIQEAKKVQAEAHHAQMGLMVQEANGNKEPFSLLLVHAQDHLMNSITFMDLAKEMVELYRRIEK